MKNNTQCISPIRWFSISCSVKVPHEGFQPLITEAKLICLLGKEQRQREVSTFKCASSLPPTPHHHYHPPPRPSALFAGTSLFLPTHPPPPPHTLSIIELAFSAAPSHPSFSNGQSSNTLYANCLLPNMLHQSGLITTPAPCSASLQRSRAASGSSLSQSGHSAHINPSRKKDKARVHPCQRERERELLEWTRVLPLSESNSPSHVKTHASVQCSAAPLLGRTGVQFAALRL